MNSDIGARARLRSDTELFLAALAANGKKRVLLTNAHPHGLAVKMAHTGLDRHLDLLLSTHTYGWYPKENQQQCQQVHAQVGFDPERILFIDDSEQILDAAKAFDLHYCLGVTNPDSGQQEKSLLAIQL